MELRVRKYEALPRKSQAKERGFRNGSADTRIVCSPPSPSWICQWAAPGAWLRGFATASIFSFPIPSPFQSPWPPNHVSCLVVNAALESGDSIRLKYVGPSKLSHEEIFRPPCRSPRSPRPCVSVGQPQQQQQAARAGVAASGAT